MISAFKTISISYSGRWSLVTLLVFFANDMGKYEPHESKVVILHKISTTLGTTATRIEHFFFKNRQLQLHVISVMIKKCEVWQSQRVSIPPAAALPPRSYKNLLNLLSACITTSQYISPIAWLTTWITGDGLLSKTLVLRSSQILLIPTIAQAAASLPLRPWTLLGK